MARRKDTGQTSRRPADCEIPPAALLHLNDFRGLKDLRELRDFREGANAEWGPEGRKLRGGEGEAEKKY